MPPSKAAYDAETNTKLCKFCKQRKSLVDFPRSKLGAGGGKTYCFVCQNNDMEGFLSIEGTTKKCTGCGEQKDFVKFFKSNVTIAGYSRRCIDCDRKFRGTQEQRRAITLKYYYNMTPAEYANRVAAQSGLCEGCGSPPPEGDYLHIDHDHNCCESSKSCGRCIRGLLCGSCNRALGLLKDNRKTLGSLLVDLEESDARKISGSI